MNRIAGLGRISEGAVTTCRHLPEGLLDMLQNRFGTASMRLSLDGGPRSSAQFLLSGTDYGSPAANEKLGLP
jgi:hypothetical protein